MTVSTALATIRGISPLSQSRKHAQPHLSKESPGEYDLRTWRHKLNLGARGTVVIPQHGMHQALAAACRYSMEQIPGKGKATWTKRFEGGIALLSEIDTGIRPEDVQPIMINAHSTGKRGVGTRVPRTFPLIADWSATFEVHILDDIITQDVFRRMLTTAGMFVGVGRFRPEVGGTNGRWTVERIDWTDRRAVAA